MDSAHSQRLAYSVEAPCASDAVASALRSAFSRDMFVPDELTEMIRELDRIAETRSSSRGSSSSQ